jgi:PAS domain S-box-containing protein
VDHAIKELHARAGFSEQADQPPAEAGPGLADPAAAVAGACAAAAPRTTWVLDAITMTGGLLCLAIGATVAVAWLVRATAILRFASPTPVSFNTALASAVTGVAMALFAARRSSLAVLIAGIFDAVLGLLVLAEFILHRDLGIDQLLVRAYLSGPDQLPGRMAGNTAVCFTVTGLGLLIWAPWRPRPRPAAVAVTGSAVAVIAITAAFGYVSHTAAAYSWGPLSSMASITADVMLILAVTLTCAAWRGTGLGAGELPRWLPMSAGTVALGLTAAVWLAIVGHGDRQGRISAGHVAAAAAVSGLLMAGLVALMAWLVQQVGTRSRLAQAAGRAAAEEEARANESRTFQFLEALPVGVFITAPDGRPYLVNREAERILGQGAVTDVTAEQLAETYGVFVAGTDQPYPTENMPIALAMRGQSAHVGDLEVHRADSSVLPVEVWGSPVFRADGEVDYAIAAFADISRRVATERAVARANKNLEEVTYSLAHDLRTPLRALSGFAEALVEDYGGILGDTGREYAGRIEAASQRMAILIDDLLHLSRVSRAEIELEPVDLSAEAAAIIGELRAEDPGRRIGTAIQPGVLVTADRKLIRIALKNLLDNAWKFTARCADACIEFGTVPAADAAVCCFVRDNGAGFDPAYTGKLFQPFQRLHPATDSPGTGIGLASARQIIERHGGRTWAEGTVGGGATFYFTLSAKAGPRPWKGRAAGGP